jgi:hypothetical protein
MCCRLLHDEGGKLPLSPGVSLKVKAKADKYFISHCLCLAAGLGRLIALEEDKKL